MWHYSLIMYSLTNKNNYKFGCLQIIKVREDSIAPVRTIIEQYGTLSESGYACSGVEPDYVREHVCAQCTLYVPDTPLYPTLYTLISDLACVYAGTGSVEEIEESHQRTTQEVWRALHHHSREQQEAQAQA